MKSRIFVAGHRGLVGRAVVRRFSRESDWEVLTRSHEELDLLDQRAVSNYFQSMRPTHAVIAAARVGGIVANSTFSIEFLYENLMIAANTIRAAADSGVEKLIFLGSSCVYPREADQPILESSLLTGPLEKTNEPYAIAKIAGLKLTEYYNRQYKKRFISAMPTNLYGPYDNFHPEHSHLVPGLMRRIHDAQVKGAPTVQVWGTGRPMRELLHVDDLADALWILMEKYEAPELINVGTGRDHTIVEIAEIIQRVVGYEGKLTFDPTRPDGTPRKLLNVDHMQKLGWSARYDLEAGLRATYQWALENRVFESKAGPG